MTEMRRYTQAELFQWASAGEWGKAVTLILTLQRRVAELEEQAETLQRAGAVSVVRTANACPTCGHKRTHSMNGGRALKCERCKTVWAVD